MPTTRTTKPTERVVYPATATYADEGEPVDGVALLTYFDDDAIAVIDVMPRSIRTRVYDLDTGVEVREFPNFVRWDLVR